MQLAAAVSVKTKARVGVAVAAGVLFGLWAEWALDRFDRPVVWVPDLVVGLLPDRCWWCVVSAVARPSPGRPIDPCGGFLVPAEFRRHFGSRSGVRGQSQRWSSSCGDLSRRSGVTDGTPARRTGLAPRSFSVTLAVLPPARTSPGILGVGLVVILAIPLLARADDPVRLDKRLAGFLFAFVLVATGVARLALSQGASRVVTVLYDLGIIVVASANRAGGARRDQSAEPPSRRVAGDFTRSRGVDSRSACRCVRGSDDQACLRATRRDRAGMGRRARPFREVAIHRSRAKSSSHGGRPGGGSDHQRAGTARRSRCPTPCGGRSGDCFPPRHPSSAAPQRRRSAGGLTAATSCRRRRCACRVLPRTRWRCQRQPAPGQQDHRRAPDHRLFRMSSVRPSFRRASS